MHSKIIIALSLTLIITILTPTITHARTAPAFANIILLQPNGDSEPELSISNTGQVALVALSWILFQTNAWTGSFGQTPTFQGGVDSMLKNGVGGGEDADVDYGSTGTIHITTLLAVFNPNTRIVQLGVSAITCPNADLSNSLSHCTSQILDYTQADRPWITSDGSHVWISYHDSGKSTGIHVWRSDDDGFTWERAGDPITAEGGVTSNSTFDNDQGKIVADSVTHNVYTVWAAGSGGLQKAKTANFNNIYVGVSNDLGSKWTPHLVFSAPTNHALNEAFPVLTADPTNGALYASWSDLTNIFVSKSIDQGSTWSAPVAVASSPVNTALEPWVAARGSTVDTVYYGTTSSSNTDPTAVWNTYLSQSRDGGIHFTQSLVSNHPNHVGEVCTGGISCKPGTRNLLDLFQIAIDPVNGLAAVIFTDDTLSILPDGSALPQVIVAYQTA